MECEKSTYGIWPQAIAMDPTSSMVDLKDQALIAGRSPSSLSDAAIVHSHWGGSLLRRRNASVPELKNETSVKIRYAAGFADSRRVAQHLLISRC